MSMDVREGPNDREARMLSEVERLSRTPEFERAPVMRKLLSFLVRTTLAGQGDELNAYAVAVEGLGRGQDFDAMTDSYPRVQVGRLRKMLDTHYSALGRGGERLTIPSGGYRVDLIEPATAPPSAIDKATPLPAIARPRRIAPALLGVLVAVVALIVAWRFDSDRGPPARALADAPALELGAITARGGEDAATLAGAARTLLGEALVRSWLIQLRESGNGTAAAVEPAVYRLTGHVDVTGALGGRHVGIALADATTGRRLWSGAMIVPPGTSLRDALRPVIATLIGPFGVIAQHERALRVERDTAGDYACMLEFDSYFRWRNPALRAGVTECVAQAVAAEPQSAVALAAASALQYDPSVTGATAEARALGAQLARRAVAADPNSAEAHIADMRVAIVGGQCRRGREIGARIAALNPWNAETIGLAGYMLFPCDYPEGEMLLRQAIALDPDVPVFYRIALALLLAERGDRAGAVAVASSARPPGRGMSAPYLLLRTVALTADGNTAAARAAWRDMAQRTGVGDDADALLARYIWVPQLRARLIAYLRGNGVLTMSKR